MGTYKEVVHSTRYRFFLKNMIVSPLIKQKEEMFSC